MSHLDGLALAEKIRNSEVTPTKLIEEAFKKLSQKIRHLILSLPHVFQKR
ncbi:hypothetical protein BN424_354 [Carnobacterium maltaromaticum LMA28]|uniref:Uncharacterized protein n=1 Tax=Carnobacterium maltaromaticum LMA28 TaxID=1234679 RepID=K8E1V9_CARML|nr:hypothetical protein BN424_354 [Carnobacterium maltaromaticum LMA28]